MQATRDQNVYSVKALLESFNLGPNGVPEVLAAFADQAELYDETLGKRFADPTEFLVDLGSRFVNPRVDLSTLKVNAVTDSEVRAEFVGVADGVRQDVQTVYGTIPASDQETKVRYTVVYRFDPDGKITEARSEFRPAA